MLLIYCIIALVFDVIKFQLTVQQLPKWSHHQQHTMVSDECVFSIATVPHEICVVCF